MIDIDHKKDYKKKRNLIIFSALTVFLILFTAFQHYILVGSPETSGPKWLFIIVADLNILLLMVVVLFLSRNIVKLYFERRRKVFGSKLKTKLVIAFVGFSMIPTALLFFYTTGTIKRAFVSWFSPEMDLASESNVSFVKAVDESYIQRAAHFAEMVKILIEKGSPRDLGYIDKIFSEKIAEYKLNSLKLYAKNQLILSTKAPGIFDRKSSFIPKEEIYQILSGVKTYFADVKYGDDNLVLYALPIFNMSGILVLNYPMTKKVGEMKILMRKKVEGYKQMKLTQKENITIYTALIGIFALLVIFSATWFGIYIAKSITIPLGRMADGIRAVKSGDLSVKVESGFTDEFTILTESFNSMTTELKNSLEEIERVQEHLHKTNIELDGRRMYMATVLQNITTGVLSIDGNGIITTFNFALRKMLNFRNTNNESKSYKEIFLNENMDELMSLIKEAHESIHTIPKKEITLNVKGNIKTLLISTAKLKNYQENIIGTVFVFEDLTQIIKAKKTNVWREIAERIAHEIKNPLTPIQLSVQMLIRKYEKTGHIPEEIFKDCINNINHEVNSLKNLVNAFSNFARLPAKKPKPLNINELIQEIVSLYNINKDKAEINFKPDSNAPNVNIDPELMKQAFKNLINNSLESTDGYKPQVEITSFYEKEANSMKICILDNGSGIKDDIKGKLFIPYFSTKPEGSGLGLAIVSRIVEDHEGIIKISDNVPRGSIFTIELPCSSKEESFSFTQNP
jgi:two-component system, NtrC family, nitrogen regulation sensor histidine kinase NtrY